MDPVIIAAIINAVTLIFVAWIVNKNIQGYQSKKILEQRKWEIRFNIFSEYSRLIVKALDKAYDLNKRARSQERAGEKSIDDHITEFNEAIAELTVLQVQAVAVFKDEFVEKAMGKIIDNFKVDKIVAMNGTEDLVKKQIDTVKLLLALMAKEV